MKSDLIARLLRDRSRTPQTSVIQAFAPANIALIKYWGKRDNELNLPRTDSLSVSLAERGSLTKISTHSCKDIISLNGQIVNPESDFAKRLISFIDLFRVEEKVYFKIDTKNTIPTAAGLASSASGFAALVKALNQLYAWDCTEKELSILARIGSGSACRSLYSGFVYWQAGKDKHGLDSFSYRLDVTWPELRIGLLTISAEQKEISSRVAMNRTTGSSILYQQWPAQVENDMKKIKIALEEKDFIMMASIAENNALAMHATMISSWPPILYWHPQSIAAMQKIWRLREQGLQLYFTMDAGPNLKLLFLKNEQQSVISEFPDIKIISPFTTNTRQL